VSDRRERLLVAASLAILTAAGLALRLHLYGDNPAWTDEVETRIHAFGPWSGPWQTAWRGWPLTQGLGFFALWKLLALVGIGGRELRLPSVLLGAAAIPLVYALARRWLAPRSALVAAAFLALSPLHVRYSREARAYALVTVEFIGFAILLLRAADRPEPRRLALLAAAAIALGWTIYGGVLMAAAGWLGLWALRRTRAIFLAATATLIALVLPLWFALLGAKGEGPRASLPFDAERAKAFLAWFGYGERLPVQAGLWLVPLLAIPGLVILWRRRKEPLLLLAIAIFPVVVIGAVPSRYPFFVRYAIHLLPVLAVAIACAADVAAERGLPAARLFAVLLFAAAASGPMRELYRERWSPWDAVARTITRNVRSGDHVWAQVDVPPLEFWGREVIEALRLDPALAVKAKDSRIDLGDAAVSWSVKLSVEFEPKSPCDEIFFPARDALTFAEREALGQGAHLGLILRFPSRISVGAELDEFLRDAAADPRKCLVDSPNS
jgi:hypothetical protein